MIQNLNLFRRLLEITPPKIRLSFLIYAIASVFFALLDVVALGLLAIATSSSEGANFSGNLKVFNIIELPTALTLIIIALVLALKSLLLLFANKLVLVQVSKLEIYLGDIIFQRVIRTPWHQRKETSNAELVRLVDTSVFRTTSTFVYPLLTIPSLLGTIFAVGIVLVIAQPVTAFITIAYFLLISFLLQKILSPRARKSGEIDHKQRVYFNKLIHEMLITAKEIQLRNSFEIVSNVISDSRAKASKSTASYIFLAAIPRQILEIALVVGLVIIGVINFALGGAQTALAALSLFALAGFRLAPALASLQATTSSIMASNSFVLEVLDYSKVPAEFAKDEIVKRKTTFFSFEQIRFKNVSFSYQEFISHKKNSKKHPALHSVDVTISKGERIGIVGTSGAGKSTFVDLLLGLIEPTSGEIYVDGEKLSEIRYFWNTSIGYVPQQIALLSGSIAQNVALCWDENYDELKVVECLDKAQLFETVSSLPEGIQTTIGENGLALSGGQRQRLGIARALYLDPQLLVLDEATSALDSATEKEITNVIEKMSKKITVISVAHRLSTISKYKRILYFDKGKIVTSGTFSELRKTIPDFEKQVRLNNSSIE